MEKKYIYARYNFLCNWVLRLHSKHIILVLYNDEQNVVKNVHTCYIKTFLIWMHLNGVYCFQLQDFPCIRALISLWLAQRKVKMLHFQFYFQSVVMVLYTKLYWCIMPYQDVYARCRSQNEFFSSERLPFQTFKLVLDKRFLNKKIKKKTH